MGAGPDGAGVFTPHVMDSVVVGVKHQRRRIVFILGLDLGVLRRLVQSAEVSNMGKILYLTAVLMRPRSVTELAAIAGVDRNYARKVCAELEEAGWMRLRGAARRRVPVPAAPWEMQEEQARRLTTLLALAPQKGEFLMKRWLDLLVASDFLMDNARPDFLCNPLSRELLEYDRFYLEGVAFEFNGWQHYGPTDVYPDEQAFRERRARDLMKKALSADNGIILVEITSNDLSLEGMEARIPDMLPRNAVDRDGPYVRALVRVSRDYRGRVAQ